MNPIDRAGNAARSVGNYISNVAREYRDVPTAIGTSINSYGMGNPESGFAKNNLINQVKEAGKSLVGKKGKGSDILGYPSSGNRKNNYSNDPSNMTKTYDKDYEQIGGTFDMPYARPVGRPK
jgi:type II secretory pathway pseudopilin PulG